MVAIVLATNPTVAICVGFVNVLRMLRLVVVPGVAGYVMFGAVGATANPVNTGALLLALPPNPAVAVVTSVSTKFLTQLVVAICVVSDAPSGVGDLGSPVKVGLKIFAFSANVAACTAALANAAVFAAVTEATTNAVVAICVVLVPELAVGAAGIPVKIGLSILARAAISLLANTRAFA